MEQIDVVLMPKAHMNLQELKKRRDLRMASERKQAKELADALAKDTCERDLALRATSVDTTSCGESSSSYSLHENAHVQTISSLKRSHSGTSMSLSSEQTCFNQRARARPSPSPPPRKRPPTTVRSQRSSLEVDTCAFESDDEPVFKPVRGPTMAIRSVLWA